MCERERERERERESVGDKATRYRSDKRYKNTKKEKIIDIYVTVIFGETLVCEESTFYPEGSTVLAIFRDCRDEVLADDPDPSISYDQSSFSFSSTSTT